MRLSYTGRRHSWCFTTGDDTSDDDPDATPQGSVAASADLTVSSSDAAQTYTYPEDRRTGFTA